MAKVEITLNHLLTKTVQEHASDLHISVGNPPIIRVRGELRKMEGYPPFPKEQTERMLSKILTGAQNERLVEEREVDFSYEVKGLSRFRGNIFYQHDAMGAVFRTIPTKPIPLEYLGAPESLEKMIMKRQGLILVTGPTGSGKTTTLASCIDYINERRKSHIVTIEDPIEYVYENKNCLIRQREVGYHARSFASALRATLRADPDVILVGEMRDLETIENALTAAETGHLVFSTLHTNNAVDSIHRVLDVFGAEVREQIGFQLAATLIGIFSQQLLPHKDPNKGMVLAAEVLIATPGIRNMIREGKVHQIRNAMITGTEFGMQSMEASLKKLLDEDKITMETAMSHAFDDDHMRQLITPNVRVIDEKFTGQSVTDMAISERMKTGLYEGFGKGGSFTRNSGYSAKKVSYDDEFF